MRRALLGLVVVASPAVAGPCLVPGFALEVATPDNAVIDQFGGVVVMQVAAMPSDHNAPRTDFVVQAWRFRDGTRRTKPTITEIAPGLAIYAPLAPSKVYGLEDTKDHVARTFGYAFSDTDDRIVTEAPKPKRVEATRNVPMFRTESTLATLAAPPPAGTIAVLVRAKGAHARSWMPIRDPKATQLEIYMRDRCQPEVPGTVATHAGDEIELAWLDATGHLSLWSATIKVTSR